MKPTIEICSTLSKIVELARTMARGGRVVTDRQLWGWLEACADVQDNPEAIQILTDAEAGGCLWSLFVEEFRASERKYAVPLPAQSPYRDYAEIINARL